jgi:hypothetical protein
VARLGDPVVALCNICGGTEFEPGPGGRPSPDGGPPRCANCGSLERHRALRRAFMLIPEPMLAWRRALQFAPDSSLEESWFRSYEGSEYGGENSIDMQAIDRADDSYDFISLSLVLEFVPDDRTAFGELLRVGSDDLILHITFNSGLTGEESSHTEEPSGEYGHYHDYGRDFDQRFEIAEHGLSTLIVEIPDPVTGDTTYPFCFFCRRRNDAQTLAAAFEAESAAKLDSFTAAPR